MVVRLYLILQKYTGKYNDWLMTLNTQQIKNTPKTLLSIMTRAFAISHS